MFDSSSFLRKARGFRMVTEKPARFFILSLLAVSPSVVNIARAGVPVYRGGRAWTLALRRTRLLILTQTGVDCRYGQHHECDALPAYWRNGCSVVRESDTTTNLCSHLAVFVPI